MNYNQKTQDLIDRMCRYVERKEFTLEKKKAEEKLLQTYDLFNLPRPKKLIWLKSPFDEKFAMSAMSARSAMSAWFAMSAGWTGLDDDFYYFVFEYEYYLNPDLDKLPNEHDKKYLKYSELLLECLEAGLGYRVEWEDTLYLAPTPIVRLNNDTPPTYHSDQLPAIKWDNQEFYYLDGVNLQKDLWQSILSQKMTFKEIMAIEISDQRTVALKYNPQAILNENSILVHKDDRNNELYRIEGQALNRDLGFDKIWFLKMLCPTGRIFIEGVPPDEAEKNPNATNMQALLCGLTLSEYQIMKLES